MNCETEWGGFIIVLAGKEGGGLRWGAYPIIQFGFFLGKKERVEIKRENLRQT